MARTLAAQLHAEGPRARSVVLVKGGPARRSRRERIRYLDCRELEEDRSLLIAPDPRAAVAGRRSSRTWTRATAAVRSAGPGTLGLFVSTFAEPAARGWRRYAGVQRCGGSEADTLLVELANALEGAVTVCRGDSDLVAVLTASGREGLTLRLDNRSYREDRAMHDSPAEETALGRTRERVARVFRPEARALETVASSPVRRAARRRRAAARAQELPRDLAHPGGPRGASFRSEAMRLPVRGGVRGSVSWPSWVDSLSPAGGDLNFVRWSYRNLGAQQRDAASATCWRCATPAAARGDADSSRLIAEEEKASARPGSGRAGGDARRTEKSGSRSAWRAHG
ncbi:hypothetical protein Q5P01_000229 [Channa striata]|uniref:Uncharacterized protein n=1 Tax=Channa striata TaxID=64152 RepID=A0AA88IY04_CHASR|nr:hypothetical protein Q5P01_000229 [Channa striata]